MGTVGRRHGERDKADHHDASETGHDESGTRAAPNHRDLVIGSS